jgi:hypothetical protein
VCGGGWLRWGRRPDVKKLLVDGFTTKIACHTRSFRVLVYLSGGDVSTSTLRYLSACLRTRRRAAGTQRPCIKTSSTRQLTLSAGCLNVALTLLR